MKKTLLAALFLLLVIPTIAQEAPPPPDLGSGMVVIQGLNGPQGLHVDADGALWIVDSGVGGETAIDFINVNTFEPVEATFGETSQILRMASPNEELELVATLPSVAAGMDFIGGARLTTAGDAVYATVGSWHISLGEDVSIENYTSVVSIVDGEVQTFADLWAHELANNPDGTENIESHPYGITVGSDGMLYVADAAANALIALDPETGGTTTIAVFEGMPGVFPNPWRGGESITDPVPTGVVIDDEGAIYVSLLSGAPFIPGSSKVVQVATDGTVSDYATGLTMLTDLQLAPDGNLYAVSFGMFTEEGPVPNAGSVIRILDDGTPEVVIDGLPFATALAIDENGNGYVAINGIAIPEAGMVVYYEALTALEGQPMPEMGR